MIKILIIEDDSDYRNIYKEILAEKYQVDEAVDGEEGWGKVVANDYNLILLDVMMPKLDGIGFLKRKKQTPAFLNIPVVIMTNLGQEEILKKCFELGAKYYILKANTTPDKILPVIGEALGGVDKNRVKE